MNSTIIINNNAIYLVRKSLSSIIVTELVQYLIFKYFLSESFMFSTSFLWVFPLLLTTVSCRY